MNRLAHLILRVANAHMNMLMDQMVRAGILEGIAGVPVGVWKRMSPPARGLAKAQAYFAEEGTRLDPTWFDPNDQGLYKTVYLQILDVTKNREDADEIAQNIVSGISRSEDVEGGQLYDIGKKKLSNDPSIAHAKGLMRMHARHRAISLLKKKREDSLTMESDEGGDVVRDIPTNIDMGRVTDEIIDALQSPQGGNLYGVLYSEMKGRFAPGKLAIFSEWVKDPTVSAVQIARNLGHGESDPQPWINRGAATYVSKCIREFREKDIPEIIRNTPGILAQVDLQQELAPLGYGQQRWAKQARNLATILRSWSR